MSAKKYALVLLLCILILTACTQAKGKVDKKIFASHRKITYSETAKNQLTRLPWDDNVRFIETVKKNNLKLMASYKAKLSNPIGGELENISHAANMLAGTRVDSGKIFSQNKIIGPYIKSRGYVKGPMYVGSNIVYAYGGGVCKIASLLYNVAMLSDLKIIERHTHSMTVPYVPPGQDATVYYGAKDLKFMNSTNDDIVVWSKMVDNVLFMAIYGRKTPPKLSWHHKTEKIIPFETIFKKNKKLSKGTKKILFEGHEGVVVSTYVTKTYQNGTIKTIKLGRRYYAPCPTVVEVN